MRLVLIGKKSEPSTLDMDLSHVYVAGSLYTLRENFPKLFAMANNRKLNTFLMDCSSTIDSIAKKVAKASSSAEPVAKKLAALSVDNVKQIDTHWEKKFTLFHKLVKANRTNIKPLLTNAKALVASHTYDGTYDGSLATLVNFPRFTLDTGYSHLAKVAIKTVHKRKPADITTAINNLDDKDTKKAVTTHITPGVKQDTKDMTPKNYPGYFTKDGKKLNKPIKTGAKITYNPDWSAKEDNNWYAKSVDPDTGTSNYHYTEAYMKKKNEDKFVKVSDLTKKIKTIVPKIEANLDSDHDRVRTVALVTYLCYIGSFRIGGDTESEKHGVRGISNLLVENITLKDKNTVKFNFIGKKTKEHNSTLKLTDKAYKLLKAKMANKKKSDYVFTYKSDRTGEGQVVLPQIVNRYLKLIGAPSSHKFRHYRSSSMFQELTAKPPITKDSSQKEKKDFLKKVLEQIKTALGHETAATTRKYYIDPSLVDGFIKKYDIDEAAKSTKKGKKVRASYDYDPNYSPYYDYSPVDDGTLFDLPNPKYVDDSDIVEFDINPVIAELTAIVASIDLSLARAEAELKICDIPIPVGRHKSTPDSQYNPEALAKGIQHELEHTDFKALAKEIAKDHLSEDMKYYDKLEQIESMPRSVLNAKVAELLTARKHSRSKRVKREINVMPHILELQKDANKAKDNLATSLRQAEDADTPEEKNKAAVFLEMNRRVFKKNLKKLVKRKNDHAESHKLLYDTDDSYHPWSSIAGVR